MRDDRTPVLAGVGQLTWRDRSTTPSPLELLVDATRAAVADAGGGGPSLLLRAASVGVVDLFSWPVPDPARALARELRLSPRETVRSQRGGTGPIELLGDAAARIAAGEVDVVLLAAAEAVNPFMAAMRDGRDLGWPQQPEGTRPDRTVGHDADPGHPAEQAASLIAPVTYYPWLEGAARARAGRGRDEHARVLAELWARYAAVARDNPHAWQRQAPDVEGLASGDGGNRLVAEPYRKLLTANIQVDQGAAVLVCSRRAALDAGVAADRLVEVRATASAHDHWFCSTRDALDRSPALRACGEAALGHGGVGIDDVAHLDLYSCFPVAVEVAGAELGFDVRADPRPPTVTGGPTFAGGPGNAYCLHAIAAMAERLREDPAALGLTTGVGWYLTKHATCLLAGPGARSARAPFAPQPVQDAVDAQPAREVAQGVAATAPVEAATVLVDREERPTVAIASAILEDGSRTVAKSDDPVLLEAWLAEDWLGRDGRFDGAGRFTFA